MDQKHTPPASINKKHTHTHTGRTKNLEYIENFCYLYTNTLSMKMDHHDNKEEHLSSFGGINFCHYDNNQCT